MLKKQVEIGKVYVVKVSGSLTRVRLDRESHYGGWLGTNLSTGREVRIRSAAKLRREFVAKTETFKQADLAFQIAKGLNTQTHGE